MKIQIPYNSEDFVIKEVNLFGIDALLVYPSFFPKWTNENKIFRSSLWRKDNLKPISLGFRKFTNLREQPEFEPIDFNQSIEYIVKKDGSLAILSKINGNLCARTRQTVDINKMENGAEIPELLIKYPKLVDNEYINSENYTILCEWYSPQNVICLKESDKSELWLIGIIKHEDYSYLSQKELDDLSVQWGILRPKRYTFNDIDSAVEFATNQKEIEGLVLYCNDGQTLKKTKASFYLRLHKFKEKANIETVLDLFVELGCPTYPEFTNSIQKQFDYECLNMVLPFCIQVSEAHEKAKKIIEHIKASIKLMLDKQTEELKTIPEHSQKTYLKMARKEQAALIVEQFGKVNLNSLAFSILQHNQLNTKQLKQLIGRFLPQN